uniref:Uncharacterized protein n=1 Tax=Rhizophora mucronata TaxID=61149 RepID=A0A2P2NML7_RHIMU
MHRNPLPASHKIYKLKRKNLEDIFSNLTLEHFFFRLYFYSRLCWVILGQKSYN